MFFSIPTYTRGRAKIVKIATGGASRDSNSRGSGGGDSGGSGSIVGPIKLFRKQTPSFLFYIKCLSYTEANYNYIIAIDPIEIEYKFD